MQTKVIKHIFELMKISEKGEKDRFLAKKCKFEMSFMVKQMFHNVNFTYDWRWAVFLGIWNQENCTFEMN